MMLHKHIEFYKREIEEVEWAWEETFNCPAITLFNKGELFKTRFEKFDEKRGTLIFSFSRELDHLPRINEEYSCFVLRKGFQDLEKCPHATYCNLLDGLGENDITDIRLVNYFEGPDPKRIGAIFADADTKFISRLLPKMLLFIGPKEPPLEYLGNLKAFSERFFSKPTMLINPWLEATEPKEAKRLPVKLLETQNISDHLLKSLEVNDTITLQGPPGVGKTYLAAQLLTTLIDQGCSVLLTALTNKAAVEVCEKESLIPYLKANKIYKASLKSNESKAYPGIQPIDKIRPIKGAAILATYYSYSRIWAESTTPTFDYVIIEEASQSFLTTIVASKLVGTKIIIIGDPYQIPPIVTQKNAQQIDQNINELVLGLETFSTFLAHPYFRKIESRRLGPRSVQFTNLFYENQLISLAKTPDVESLKAKIVNLGKFIHPKGGPVLITMNLPNGRIVPMARKFIISILEGGAHKSYRIAVLAPFRETVGEMQGKVMKALNNYNIFIDTVDRVQGLDVDICFYVIPKGSHEKSLQFNRFNVATSRSKIATIIIADETILSTNVGHPNAILYIKELSKDCHFKI